MSFCKQMENRKNNAGIALVPLLFFAAVAVFCLVLAPYRLGFKEQTCIFAFNSGMFSDYFRDPGFLSVIIGDFLSRFYWYNGVAVFLTVLLLVSVWAGLRVLLKRAGADGNASLLALLPVSAETVFAVYLNYPVSATVGLALSVWCAVLFSGKPKGNTGLIFPLAAGTPLVFLLAGGHALTFALILLTIGYKEWRKVLPSAIIGIGLMILVGRFYNLNFQQTLIWPVPTEYIVPPVSCLAIVPLLSVLCLAFGKRLSSFVCSLAACLVLVPVFFLVRDENLESSMRLGTTAYRQEWDKVKRLAESVDSKSPYSIYYRNLCYAREGRLAEELFRHPQELGDGLFLSIKRGSSYLASFFFIDGLLEMGDVSQATDASLLGQTVMPSQFSTRMLRYLSEIAVVTGDYDVARKYLDILSVTPMHMKWARELMSCVDTDSIPEKYQVWRSRTATVDRTVAQGDWRSSLKNLADLNPMNRTAIDYLLCSMLLDKRGKSFEGYYERYWLDRLDRYYEVPAVYQQALLVNAYSDDSLRDIVEKYHIAGNIAERYLRFQNTMERANGNLRALGEYKDTYWYYIISTSIVENQEQ